MGQLLFKKCFFAAIVAGTKTTTIRRWSSPRVKPGERAFTPGIGWLTIDAVETIELDELNEGDALADGFASLAQLRRVLRKLYPSARMNGDGKRWFRVSFRRDKDATTKKHDPKARPRRGKAQRRPGSVPPSSTALQRRALVDSLRNPAPALLR